MPQWAPCRLLPTTCPHASCKPTSLSHLVAATVPPITAHLLPSSKPGTPAPRRHQEPDGLEGTASSQQPGPGPDGAPPLALSTIRVGAPPGDAGLTASPPPAVRSHHGLYGEHAQKRAWSSVGSEAVDAAPEEGLGPGQATTRVCMLVRGASNQCPVTAGPGNEAAPRPDMRRGRVRPPGGLVAPPCRGPRAAQGSHSDTLRGLWADRGMSERALGLAGA